MLAQTTLNGQKITYTLKRCKRKSIGLRIDHRGLSISVPMQAALPHLESILQEKADWITKKLGQWQNKKSLTPAWTHNTVYPLLGDPWRIAMKSSGEIQMARQSINEAVDNPHTAVFIRELTPRQIEKFVMTWYGQQAITCFKQRIAVYAPALDLPPPPFRLSRAKTRWGSCNARGMIHLNWRLIQMPLHLVDYVVAHELSHLIEMNHSTAFWKLVQSVYPNYQMARRELREYG